MQMVLYSQPVFPPLQGSGVKVQTEITSESARQIFTKKKRTSRPGDKPLVNR